MNSDSHYRDQNNDDRSRIGVALQASNNRVNISDNNNNFRGSGLSKFALAAQINRRRQRSKSQFPSTSSASSQASTGTDTSPLHTMAAMAATTPNSSNRRTKRTVTPDPDDSINPPIKTIAQAKEVLQQQQQQQQRKLHQLQQEHYQKSVSEEKTTPAVEAVLQEPRVSVPPPPPPPPPAFPPTTTKTPTERRTFQQQYMEQQAQLDRQTKDKNYHGHHKPRRSNGSDEDDDSNLPPQAKLVGAATAMSTSITFAMNKFQELLQPSATINGTNSQLVYTATSESFTSSLAAGGEEKKDTVGDEHSYEEDDTFITYDTIDYDDLIQASGAACTSYYNPRKHQHHSKHPHHHHHHKSSSRNRHKKKDRRRKTAKSKRNNKSSNNSILSAPSAVSATDSVLSGFSSVTGATNVAPPSSLLSFVEEVSPMMRMRHPNAQHALEIRDNKNTNQEEDKEVEGEGQESTETPSTSDIPKSSSGSAPLKSTNKKTPSPTTESESSILQPQDHQGVHPSLTAAAAAATVPPFKTEEQVKAEKQVKWKRKMKIAQQQRQQEQEDLGYQQAASRSYSSLDTDDLSYDDETYDDDISDVSFGCRPGSNFAEIWSSIANGMDPNHLNMNRSTMKAAAKNPMGSLGVLQKIVSARCAELREVSSSEDEDDDGYSFSEDDDEDESQDAATRRRRRDKKDRRGRSRRPRSKSPHSQSSRTRETSVQSQSSRNSRTSRQSETSLGDILGRRDEEEKIAAAGPAEAASEDTPDGDKDPRSKRDRLELEALQQKPNFRIIGKQKDFQEQSQLSGHTDITPLAGTASTILSSAGTSNTVAGSTPSSIPSDDDDSAPRQADTSTVGQASTALGVTVISDCDTPSITKGSMKKAPSLRSVKSVSFDESTITKTQSVLSIPTVANLDRTDPNFIRNFVAGLSHHGTPMLWHSTPALVETAAAGSSSASVVSAASGAQPDSVMAYLRLQENGSGAATADGFGEPTQPSLPLSTALDSPRLIWCRETHTSKGLKREELGNIDLFDIASIETAATMSSSFLKALGSFPYSMPSRTLVIQLNNRSSNDSGDPEWFFPSKMQMMQSPAASTSNMIVLEATSDDAAMTLVMGMKWMLARLAFNLIVGNLTISCELLRPEQQQPTPIEDRGSEDDSMGPACRPPIVRRTKVMNDMTFHMLDKVLEKSKRYQKSPASNKPDDDLPNEFKSVLNTASPSQTG